MSLHITLHHTLILKLLVNLLDKGLDPQAALDAPRFCVDRLDSAVGPASVEDSHVLLVRQDMCTLLHWQHLTAASQVPMPCMYLMHMTHLSGAQVGRASAHSSPAGRRCALWSVCSYRL